MSRAGAVGYGFHVHVPAWKIERDGLRVMHAAISGLLDGVNAIAVAQATAEPAGRDWREGDSGQELRAAAMHATMRCSHDARHRGEFYEAAAAATRVIAARLRELYGSLAGRRIGG